MIKEFAVISRKNRKKITKFASGGGDGAEVIYALRNNSTLSKKILDEIAKEGQNIRKYYQQRLPSNSMKDYYFMHRDTPNNETVIVEYGFIDSPKDDVEQIQKNYEKYAEAVVRAVADYKGIKYVAPVNSDYYTVKKGDSLWSIANKYGTTVNKLKELNNLSSNVLQIGQTLKISSNEKDAISDDYFVYKVKSGDSLWNIAKEYNTTVDKLKEINNLKNDKIIINQQLLIPKNTTSGVNFNNYTVKNGDTLWDIANDYNTTVSELKSLNNLSTNVLQIGQVLKVPSKKQSTYTVRKGDSLWKIAEKYNTSVNELMKLNNLSNSTLQIGESLLIPN